MPSVAGGQPYDSTTSEGEFPAHFKAKTENLTLYTKPSQQSKVLEHRKVKKGQNIDYSETKFRIKVPGKVKVIYPYTFRIEKTINTAPFTTYVDVDMKPGEIFDYLQYLGEGYCLIRVRGEEMSSGECPWLMEKHPFSSHFNYMSKPVSEWWINLTPKGKKPDRWLRVEKATLESDHILP